MKTHLKKYISNNIFLYYLWFKLIRQRKGISPDFFKKDTDVYIDGFPRSGNTFLIHLVGRLVPELKAVHHLHAVAPIKIALLLEIPVFILIRNPMDCVSSHYLKHFAMQGKEVNTKINVKLVDFIISDYLNYHTFVKKNLDNVSLIPFNELINSTQLVLQNIQDQLNIEKKITDEALTKAKASYRGATNTMGSSRPNKEKEMYKSIVKEYIVESEKYSDILKLYDSLIS